MKIIPISGVIGWDVDPASIRRALEEANGEDIVAEFSSPGGFIGPGLEISNLFKNYSGHTTARLTGYAQSMSSYIPMAFDRIEAEENAVFMIHNARGGVMGDHNGILKYGRHLQGLSGLMAKAYARRSGTDLKEIARMMDEETFFYGEEMLEAGFVDAIIESSSDTDKDTALATAKASFEECQALMAREHAKAREDMQQLAAALATTEPAMVVPAFDNSAELVDEPWDKSASETRWREHAGVESRDDLPNATYSKRFAFVDDKENFSGYHFPIWDFKDREFVNIAAVRNGLSRLPQSTAVPERDKPRVESLLRKYLDKFNEQDENNRADNPPPAAAASRKQTPEKGGKTMDLGKLKAEHPDVYAAAVQIGVIQERDRVSAHLTMGEASGDMKTACSSIKDGLEMTASLQATYMAAGMNKANQNARQDDDAAAAAAANGAAADDDADASGNAVASAVEAKLGIGEG